VVTSPPFGRPRPSSGLDRYCDEGDCRSRKLSRSTRYVQEQAVGRDPPSRIGLERSDIIGLGSEKCPANVGGNVRRDGVKRKPAKGPPLREEPEASRRRYVSAPNRGQDCITAGLGRRKWKRKEVRVVSVVGVEPRHQTESPIHGPLSPWAEVRSPGETLFELSLHNPNSGPLRCIVPEKMRYEDMIQSKFPFGEGSRDVSDTPRTANTRLQHVHACHTQSHLFLYHHATTYCVSDNAWIDSAAVQRPTQTRTMTAPRNSAAVHLRRISEGVPRDPQQVLTAAFTAIDYLDCIKNLARWQIDPQAYINGLDQVGSRLSVLVSDPLTPLLHQILDTLSPELDIYKRCLRALRKTCGIYGLLPASHFLSPEFIVVNKRPFASGGFAEVWKVRSRDNQTFAVKRLKIHEVDSLADMNKVLRLCCSVPTRISYWKTTPRDTAKRLSSASE